MSQIQNSTAHPDCVAAFATKGSGTNEEARLRILLSQHDAAFIPYDKAKKLDSFISLLKWIAANRPDLLIMEGTGIGGGAACLIARLLWKTPFVVSSGDAVGPFVAAIRPAVGPVFSLYERLLYRWAAGFIGWTPYLVGRALTFGVPRALTAAGWTPYELTKEQQRVARQKIRAQLGVSEDTLVFGIIGALVWNRRYAYCYGAELVRAIALVPKTSKVVVVVGGSGSGLPYLQQLASSLPSGRVHLLGEIAGEQVMEYLAAMDVASLPQSVDGVGSFRYTTKLSEILAAGLPVITGQIPLAYDLDSGWLWRLPGEKPWDSTYIKSLASLMSRLTLDEAATKASSVPKQLPEFNAASQVQRVGAFVQDILNSKCLKKRLANTGQTLISDDGVKS